MLRSKLAKLFQIYRSGAHMHGAPQFNKPNSKFTCTIFIYICIHNYFTTVRGCHVTYYYLNCSKYQYQQTGKTNSYWWAVWGAGCMAMVRSRLSSGWIFGNCVAWRPSCAPLQHEWMRDGHTRVTAHIVWRPFMALTLAAVHRTGLRMIMPFILLNYFCTTFISHCSYQHYNFL